MARAGVGDPIPGVAYPRWDVEADLDLMDRHGIRTAVVSITAPAWDSTTRSSTLPGGARPHRPAGLRAAALPVRGTDRILFGTDHPFMPESTTAETIAGIGDFFDGSDLVDVEQNNAVALLPRLAEIHT